MLQISSWSSLNCTLGKPPRPSNTAPHEWHLFSPKWLWITLKWPSRLLLSLNSSGPRVLSGKWIWIALVFLSVHRKSVSFPWWALILTRSLSSALLCTISSCQSPKRGQEGWLVWNLADKADLTVHSICVRLSNCAEQLVSRSAADVEWWCVLYWLAKLCLCRVIYNLNIKSCLGYCFRNISLSFLVQFWIPWLGSQGFLAHVHHSAVVQQIKKIWAPFSTKKLPLSAVFQTAMPCLLSAQQCPWNKLLIMIFPSLPQTVEHGFPHQPSALGYSPFLRLMAIGTRSGAIKLYPLNALGESSLTSTECAAVKALQKLG